MSPTSRAKATLLRALESIEDCENELDGKGEVRHLCVVYSVVRTDDDGIVRERGGYNHTDDPHWLIGAMLRYAADSLESDVEYADDE